MTSFRINRVYTRTGDQGETALVGGQRVSKSDLRVEAFGEVDELNSVLGICKEHVETPLNCLTEIFEFIQQELFDIGAELACSPEDGAIALPRTTPDQVSRLESWCDRFNQGLPELTSFIVPGGSKIAAYLHLARTVCRRAERRIVALQSISREENSEIVRYVNRLSDLLFILVRWSLDQEKRNPGLWVVPDKRVVPAV